ncbi:MAG: serine protease [Patescibacteria group bacterium]|nr:serine protease [Patescibacteria group bacterium]
MKTHRLSLFLPLILACFSVSCVPKFNGVVKFATPVVPHPKPLQIAEDLPRASENAAATYYLLNVHPRNHGTGFAIHPDGWLLTAAHVVSDKGTGPFITVLDEKGRPTVVRGEVKFVDKLNDLAAVKFPVKFRATVVIGRTKDAPWGGMAYSVSYPYDLGLTFFRGYIANADSTSLFEMSKTEYSYQHQVLMKMGYGHGSSGSAMFDMKHGRVISLAVTLEPQPGPKYWKGPAMLMGGTRPVRIIRGFLIEHNVPFVSAPLDK